jgi:hypothetical protein
MNLLRKIWETYDYRDGRGDLCSPSITIGPDGLVPGFLVGLAMVVAAQAENQTLILGPLHIQLRSEPCRKPHAPRSLKVRPTQHALG